jgi:hypothetical protein
LPQAALSLKAAQSSFAVHSWVHLPQTQLKPLPQLSSLEHLPRKFVLLPLCAVLPVSRATHPPSQHAHNNAWSNGAYARTVRDDLAGIFE